MTILIVDEDVACLSQLKETIKKIRKRDRVITFSSAVEALQYAENHQTDFAFVAMYMKQLSGLILVQKLKETNRNIQTVLLSPNRADAMLALRIHANDFLLKPVAQEELHRIFIL